MSEHDRLLTDVQHWRARGRRLAHAGAWLPALTLAGLPLLSIALYARPLSPQFGSVAYPYWAGLPSVQRDAIASYVFWLLAEPLAFVMVALWYRHREHRHGVRVRWRTVAGAGTLGLLLLVALSAAPTGEPVGLDAPSAWQGLLTPLLTVGIAAVALGIIERSVGIVLSGAWMALVSWQFCATARIGGLFGWQDWLLDGGSGPALGGQLTLLGLDRPVPALVAIALPLALVAGYRALRTSP